MFMTAIVLPYTGKHRISGWSLVMIGDRRFTLGERRVTICWFSLSEDAGKSTVCLAALS